MSKLECLFLEVHMVLNGKSMFGRWGFRLHDNDHVTMFQRANSLTGEERKAENMLDRWRWLRPDSNSSPLLEGRLPLEPIP